MLLNIIFYVGHQTVDIITKTLVRLSANFFEPWDRPLHVRQLPDLVLVDIFKYVANGKTDLSTFKQQLACLKVCTQWRYVGYPVVFRNLIIDYSHHSVLSTNIDLYRDKKQQQTLVRKVKINNLCFDFASKLGHMLSVLNMSKVSWPQNYTLDDGYLDGISRYNLQELDSMLVSKMSSVLSKFAKRFHRVASLDMNIECPCGVAKQFSSELIRVFNDQLKILKCHIDAPLDINQFPPNLTTLVYSCHRYSYPLLVPQINPLPLRCLKLNNVLDDFSWKQTFQIYGNSVNLPNLKILSLNSGNSTDSSTRKQFANGTEKELIYQENIKEEKIELPNLQKLLVNKNYYVNVPFNPKTISPHLRELTVNVSVDDFHEFVKLPIVQVGKLDISVQGQVVDNQQLQTTIEQYILQTKPNQKSIKYFPVTFK